MFCHAICRDNVMLRLCEPFFRKEIHYNLKTSHGLSMRGPRPLNRFTRVAATIEIEVWVNVNWLACNPKRIAHFGIDVKHACTTQFPRKLHLYEIS